MEAQSGEIESANSNALESTDGNKPDKKFSDEKTPEDKTDPDLDGKPKKRVFREFEVNPDEPCDHCTERFCTKINGRNFIEECETGKKSAICKALVDCAQKTKCAKIRSSDCYCGNDADIGQCMENGGTGPCKEEVEKAAETKTPREIALRYADSKFPVGRAMAVIDCKTNYCPKCGE
jgi:hypothetical protein